jgi:hypothetical protein
MNRPDSVAGAINRMRSDLELDEELDLANRLVRRLGTRVDPAAHGRDALHREMLNRQAIGAKRQHSHGTLRSQFLRFLRRFVLAISFLLFAVGALVWAWSLWHGQPAFWHLGALCALAGEAGLVFSLAVHLLGDARHDGADEERLLAINEQLRELQHSSLGVDGDEERTFYAQLAAGASPHLLLSNLRQRLDRLAEQLKQ